MFTRKFLKTLLPLWITVLTVGSFLPASFKQAIGTKSATPSVTTSSTLSWSHRAWHVGSFGLTTLLVSLVARSTQQRLLLVTAVFGLGLSIEILQSIVFAEQFEWWDVRDDGYGIVIMLVISQLHQVRYLLLREARLSG